ARLLGTPAGAVGDGRDLRRAGAAHDVLHGDGARHGAVPVGGVIGGAIAVAGVALVFVDQLRATVPPAALAALFLQAVAVAGSTVLLKRLPRADPIGTNAVAMLCGAAFLLVVALLARETPVLPSRPEVWVAFLYLVTLGGIGLFIGVVFIVLRCTASASAYVTVLFLVVTV